MKPLLVEHNRGKCNATKNRGPWLVRYTENFSNRDDAYRRERQIKKYKGGRAFKSLINIDGS